MRPRVLLVFWLFCVHAATAGGALAAEPVSVAVASNFRAVAERLADRFEDETGHPMRIVGGSSGQLYAQIVNGAPHDVFLSADQARPRALIDRGLADPASVVTYAEGWLFFAAPGLPAGPGIPADLGAIRRISIANPRLAPYGAAAQQALGHMALGHAVVAQAQNIAGVMSAVLSGAVDAGFVALAAVRQLGDRAPSGWPVPQAFHDPIRQDAVLLLRARDNPGARRFLDWLGSGPVRALIRDAGYDAG